MGVARTVFPMTINSTKTLLAVDGNSLFHRAFHAYGKAGLTNQAGEGIWALHGFCMLLAGIVERVNPDAMVVGFDTLGGSERRSWYPEYKATRAAKDPELPRQMGELITLLPTLGVTTVIPEGWEADDVCASAAELAETNGWRCVVATSDRDAFALVSPSTSVLRLVSGLNNAVMYTPEVLSSDVGVAAVPDNQYLDFAALRGDTSDNLPGVTGIGKVTAAKLLAEFPTVAAMYAALDEDPAKVAAAVGKSAATKLAKPESREAWERNRRMMSMRRDLPLGVSLGYGPGSLPLDAEVVRPALQAAELPQAALRWVKHLCQRATVVDEPTWDYVADEERPLPDDPFVQDAPMPVSAKAPRDGVQMLTDAFSEPPAPAVTGPEIAAPVPVPAPAAASAPAPQLEFF